MHRVDNSKYVLFIEPKDSDRGKPVNDWYSEVVQKALERAVSGTSLYGVPTDQGHFLEDSGYRGTHPGPNGLVSSACDYLLPGGYITNSLALYYIRDYRSAVPSQDLEKIKDIAKHMNYDRPAITESTAFQIVEERPEGTVVAYGPTFMLIKNDAAQTVVGWSDYNVAGSYDEDFQEKIRLLYAGMFLF